jgi:hypothetical protein
VLEGVKVDRSASKSYLSATTNSATKSLTPLALPVVIVQRGRRVS